MVVNKMIEQPGSPFLDSFKEAKALPNDDLHGDYEGGRTDICMHFLSSPGAGLLGSLYLQCEVVAPCQDGFRRNHPPTHHPAYTYSFHRWGQAGATCPQTGTETPESLSGHNRNRIRRQRWPQACTRSPARLFSRARSLVFCSRLLEERSTMCCLEHEAQPGQYLLPNLAITVTGMATLLILILWSAVIKPRQEGSEDPGEKAADTTQTQTQTHLRSVAGAGSRFPRRCS